MSIASPIAERVIHAVAADGHEFQLALRVGPAYRSSDVSWSCPVEAIGLHDRLADIVGIDSWQVVQLSFRFLASLVAGFVERGGKLFYSPGGEPVSPAELWPNG